MNTSTQARSVSTSFVGRVAPVVSPQVQQVVTLGRQQGWNCAVLGQAPFPNEPVRLGDWLIVPAQRVRYGARGSHATPRAHPEPT
jgi:hypothetical protein